MKLAAYLVAGSLGLLLIVLFVRALPDAADRARSGVRRSGEAACEAGAHQAGTRAPQAERLLQGVSLAAGIPTPQLFIVDDPDPNAFAYGRTPRASRVAVSSARFDDHQEPRRGGETGAIA